ncbi:MAG TPA: FtsX-like permease family protein [Dokdonella sp.]|nr:FtsX-like permease family protein [Dokdonella sp.]
MSALARKALRDLWHLRGQALAIALVIAAGIANLVMAQSTYESLQETREHFYREYAFADVFASAKRVPQTVSARIAAMAGVQTVQTRLMASGNLHLAGFDEPVRAQLLSVPKEGGQPDLNRLYLRAGRLPLADGHHEAVIGEAFASAHGLKPGDAVEATIYGHRERLDIVGIAISPEYVYQIQPGATFPDYQRFAIVWINQRVLESALDMQGAFNSVTLRLRPGIDPAGVIGELDRLLTRYGGLGAYARKDQISNHFLSEELRQLQMMAKLFPIIFLSVAAFLLSVVMTRLIDTQRDQVAILKAFGYSGLEIGRHFLAIVGAIAAIGTVLGIAGGAWLGSLLAGIYQEFYRFPFLDYHLSAFSITTGVVVAIVASFIGAWRAVVKAVRLPPAEAMRPPAPGRFHPSLLERMGLMRFLSQPNRMILRNIERRPWKATLSVIGLALACAIMMVGRFQENAINRMIDVQLRLSAHQDISVDFIEATARAALSELRALPDVRAVEPVRAAPVRLRHANYSYRTGLSGLARDASLRRPVDALLQPITAPAHGVLLTDYLQHLLHVEVGDLLEIEVLQGRQAHVEVPVAGFVHEYIGAQAYMDLDAMNRLLGDGDVVSGALLAVDGTPGQDLFARLDRRPRIAGFSERKADIQSFYDTMGESLLVFTFISMLLGGVINFGVVYNSARIALSERGRELASLRVLGFTRGEIGHILLGELFTLVAVSIPLGCAAGWALCWIMARNLQSDLFRVPLVLLPSTFAFAILTMAGSTLISAMIVRRRIARLDLVAVLKTRE